MVKSLSSRLGGDQTEAAGPAGHPPHKEHFQIINDDIQPSLLWFLKLHTRIDQISIKTPNPKCRLYWCLIEFITGDTVCHVGLSTPLVNKCPSNLLTGSPTPPFPASPLPCVNKYSGMYSNSV